MTDRGPRALEDRLVCLCLSAVSRSVLHLQEISRQVLQIIMVATEMESRASGCEFASRTKHLDLRVDTGHLAFTAAEW